MSSAEKKYRRTRRVVTHANPLFDTWLLEWQEEAGKRDSKMKYNFQRARKSLSLYPLPLYTGRDCKLLANFGNKICQMLDQRLAQHEEEFGATDWMQIHKIKGTPRSKKRKKTSTSATVTVPSTSTPVASTARGKKSLALQVPGKSGSEDTLRKRRSRSKRQYIPLFRSGAYALLMALYRATFQSNYEGFMKKDDLIADAQPLCDSSFSKPDKVGCYYSAWSSINTLIKNGLVARQSRPPKFSLTDEGKALAMQLDDEKRNVDTECVENLPPVSPPTETAREQLTDHHFRAHTLSSSSSTDDSEEDGDGGVGEVSFSTPFTGPSPISPQPNCTSREGEKEVEWEEEESTRRKKVSKAGPLNSPTCKNNQVSRDFPRPQSSTMSAGMLRFSYVSSLDLETPLKDKASVTVEEDGFLGFLIKCGASNLQESGFHHRLDHTRTAPPGFVYAYLSNECAPDQCTGLDWLTAKPSTPAVPTVDPKHPTAKSKRKKLSNPPSDSSASFVPSSKKKPAQSQRGLNAERILMVPLTPASTDVTSASSSMPFILSPGNFEVILCIDIAETSGKSADAQPSKKDVILSELMRNGVKYDIRKLHVGDFLWVCREVPSHASLSHRVSRKEVRELVLPVVIERKRMDDLVRSIKDGRFREQKFRLQQCGLSRPVYLVEESHGSVAPGLGMPETTYLQAIVNTQVINGFTVKVVRSQRESAAYLTIMTRYLQTKYQNMTLRSAQLQELKGNQTCPSSEMGMSLLPFSEFNTASMKNQQLTVQEMFAKHLLQLHGVSVDKARAVVDKYGTPSLLMTAYEEAANTHEAKKLLADLKWGKAGRSLGPVLSANIASLYTTSVLQ